VAELIDGELVPFPDVRWNSWTPEADPTTTFVCVQSVVADTAGHLWVLDPGRVRGLVEGGTKLIRFDLATGEPVTTYRFREPEITPSSYLNDVRIDLESGFAYMTDSGDGAILVTDLASGISRRLLDDHPSTQAEEVTLTIEGEPWVRSDGSSPRVHSDGIALSPDRTHLYYQALTGRTLYRIPTAALRDADLPPEDLARQVEVVGETGAADGLIFGADGMLYISALEESAIRRLDPVSGETEVVVADERIRWPDTFTRDPAGRILFTTAQIHLGREVSEPYRIFRIEAR
jgi:sugar lactone lactonase YvrE